MNREEPKAPSTWGGVRPGVGRPETGRKHKTYFVSPEEDKEIIKFIKHLRETKPAK